MVVVTLWLNILILNIGLNRGYGLNRVCFNSHDFVLQFHIAFLLCHIFFLHHHELVCLLLRIIIVLRLVLVGAGGLWIDQRKLVKAVETIRLRTPILICVATAQY